MVTIDFGAFGSIDMRDTAALWDEIFGPAFDAGFDGRYTSFGLRHQTHGFDEYQLDTPDGVDGVGPSSGAAVWFYGHGFDYNGVGRPIDGAAHEIQVYNSGDVRNNYETYRVLIYDFSTSLPEAVDIAESQDLDPLLEGERLKILGHRFDDFLVGGGLSDQLYGYGGRDRLEGGAGNDFLDGGVDRDILRGDDGNDTLAWRPGDGPSRGGSGFDTLRLHDSVNLTTLANDRLGGIERVDMTGGGGDVLRLDASEVLALSPRDELTILGDYTDVVHRGAGWSYDGINDGFYVYTQGQATLLVDIDIYSVV